MIDGMFTCMNCGYVVFSSKRNERCLKFYQQRAELLSKVSRDANVRISADSLLDYWQGADLDSRASVTWEGEQLRKGRQRLHRAMKLGFFNVVHRYQLDNTFASSLANVNRDLSDCVLWDTFSVLRLAGVERSAGQRTLGTGPLERIDKRERAHVAKVCFITVPYRLLHDEFKDRHGSEWMGLKLKERTNSFQSQLRHRLTFVDTSQDLYSVFKNPLGPKATSWSTAGTAAASS